MTCKKANKLLLDVLVFIFNKIYDYTLTHILCFKSMKSLLSTHTMLDNSLSIRKIQG